MAEKLHHRCLTILNTPQLLYWNCLTKDLTKAFIWRTLMSFRIQGLFENPVSFSNREQFSQEIFEVLPDANMLNKKVTYIIIFLKITRFHEVSSVTTDTSVYGWYTHVRVSFTGILLKWRTEHLKLYITRYFQLIQLLITDIITRRMF